ncbi:transcription antitermination factor NusB [Candidatus Kaiserbacteria bacterium]|nr:MAG: transcription antitermination factor NusB [Candidatus Kaiserbacteria bacterium]
MSNRHTARSVVLQTLFELDSEGMDRSRADDILVNNANEFAPNSNLFPFMKQLLETALAKQTEIDAIIVKAAPEWPLEKIAVTDRNILRLGLSELLYSDRGQVPPKVAINEAIELGKEFGGESSGRFINGVLGAVYKEMGEPEKEQTGKTKKTIDEANLRTEEIVGAVVYAEEEGQLYVALVHDVFGHWTLCKGKLKEGEDSKAGALRKVKEEIGLEGEVISELGENTYVASDPNEGKKKRHGQYHLVQVPFDDLTLKSEGGLDDAQWFKLADIIDLNFYDDILPVVTRAVNVLVQHRT